MGRSIIIPKSKTCWIEYSTCITAIRRPDEIWKGIIEANAQTDGLASDAVHVRFAFILGSWSKSFQFCHSWSRCTCSVQLFSTDEVHFLKDNGMRVKQGTVLPFTAGRTGIQHKTAVAQSMGIPSCFIFSMRAFICSFFLSTISMRIKNVDRWLLCPLPCYVVWNLTLPFLLNWRMRLQLLFMSASFWSLALVSSVFSTSEAYIRLPTCLPSLTSKALKLLHPSNLA